MKTSDSTQAMGVHAPQMGSGRDGNTEPRKVSVSLLMLTCKKYW
jgi:hypothetical protein